MRTVGTTYAQCLASTLENDAMHLLLDVGWSYSIFMAAASCQRRFLPGQSSFNRHRFK
jgi:hypothetical protein